MGWGKGKEESGRVKDPISEDPTPSSELCGPKARTRYTYIFARKALLCIKIFKKNNIYIHFDTVKNMRLEFGV